MASVISRDYSHQSFSMTSVLSSVTRQASGHIEDLQPVSQTQNMYAASYAKRTSKAQPSVWHPKANIKSNSWKRVITGLTLLAYFCLTTYVGYPLILLTALIIQISCFREIIDIAFTIKKLRNVPYFKALNWYFVLVANYFFSGEIFSKHVDIYVEEINFIGLLLTYHRFVSFCMYFAGMICFIYLLRKQIIRRQFSLLAWTHFLLIIISFQTYMVIENTFEGLIWFIVPFWLVVANDVFAYISGRLLGKTPLISLSPNKTVEGFVGAAIATFIVGAVISPLFCKIQYFVCPVQLVYNRGVSFNTMNSTTNYIFEKTRYYLGDTELFIDTYPFVLHSFSLSFFASIVAPFGGFCASGFKRAFNIKDFSAVIPGHGGFVDRFDCQFLMATFVNVYISTFIKTASVEKILRKILYLNEKEQLLFFRLLKKSLVHNLILENDTNRKPF